VRNTANAERVGHDRDPLALAQAAGRAAVRLDDVETAPDQQCLDTKPRELGFAPSMAISRAA
jgi:hypothetical protein